MKRADLPESFLTFLNTIKGKRARVVIDHILEYGFITTEDLESQYGYKHPPRAVRDVREQGIPIETFSVKDAQGRSIAAYRFGDPEQVRRGRLGGRKTFPKTLKTQLLEKQNGQCAICTGSFDTRYLQIDHRVPYEVAGDPDGSDQTDDYMLLCGSCNRAKSWSCEQCENWLTTQNPALCMRCYWANPIDYQHIALESLRRIAVVWSGHETDDYAMLQQVADNEQMTLPDYVKAVLRHHLQSRKDKS